MQLGNLSIFVRDIIWNDLYDKYDIVSNKDGSYIYKYMYISYSLASALDIESRLDEDISKYWLEPTKYGTWIGYEDNAETILLFQLSILNSIIESKKEKYKAIENEIINESNIQLLENKSNVIEDTYAKDAYIEDSYKSNDNLALDASINNGSSSPFRNLLLALLAFKLIL